MLMKPEELHKQAESRRPEFKKSFGKDLVKGNYIALHRDKLGDNQNSEIAKW
jgi:hypothetical protein